MAKGEPRKRATDPVVAGEIAATLTREELAGAIRTLVAMAACWERRDPATTEADAFQAAKLRQIVDLLGEAAADQTESAESILSTLMRDELAVAMGAAKEQVADVLITTGADAGSITQQKLTQECTLPPGAVQLPPAWISSGIARPTIEVARLATHAVERSGSQRDRLRCRQRIGDCYPTLPFGGQIHPVPQ
jgi:hypothetical protein